MAIYGAGSNWNGEEVSEKFFSESRFIIGWNRSTGSDLHASLASLKLGDIIYLKSNRPGARTIRVKGIGFVTKSFIECIHAGDYSGRSIEKWESFYIGVKWILQDEFRIDIPPDAGRLTNIRAATFYEEPLPFVQAEILSRLFLEFRNRELA